MEQPPTDAQLLDRFARRGDQGAFAALVERHAGLVLAACRRQLGETGGAEDAAQAVFLVLARKAGGLKRRRPLAGWLFRAAGLAARQARRDRDRRARREREAGEVRRKRREERKEAEEKKTAWQELRPVLDTVLAELPRAQREALVLHYLAGRSQTEIARELTVGQSTVAMRLARGLARLREKLTRRGLALPAALLAALLAERAAPAAPAGCATFAAATAAAAAGRAAPSAGTLLLKEEIMKAMLWMKVKLAGLALAAAALLAAAVPGTLWFVRGEETISPPPLATGDSEATAETTAAPPATADATPAAVERAAGTPAVVDFPLGAVDPAGELVFVRGENGDLEALELATGRVRWRRAIGDEGRIPLAGPGWLAVIGAVTGEIGQYGFRITFLETADGRDRRESDLVALPYLVAKVKGANQQQNWLRARRGGDELIVDWRAAAVFVGGMPGDLDPQDPDRTAAGQARVDPASGRVEARPAGADGEEAVRRRLLDSLRPRGRAGRLFWSATYPDDGGSPAAGWSGNPFLHEARGGWAALYQPEPGGNRYPRRLILAVFDRRTGRETGRHELTMSRNSAPEFTRDGGHLFLEEVLYSLETGERVPGVFPPVAGRSGGCCLIGERLFAVYYGESQRRPRPGVYAASSRTLRCLDRTSGEERWSHPLLPYRLPSPRP